MPEVERGCMSAIVGDPTAGGNYTPLSLTNATLSMELDTMEDGNRGGSYRGKAPGLWGWQLEASGLVPYTETDDFDPALAALRNFMQQRQHVDVYVQRPGGGQLAGQAIVTAVRTDGRFDGLLQGTYSLKGTGVGVGTEVTGSGVTGTPTAFTDGPLFAFTAVDSLTGITDGAPVPALNNTVPTGPDADGTGITGNMTAETDPNGARYLSGDGTGGGFSFTSGVLPNGEQPITVLARVRMRPKTNSTLFATNQVSSPPPYQYDFHLLNTGAEFSLGPTSGGEIPFSNGQWFNIAGAIMPGRGRFYRIGGSSRWVYDSNSYPVPSSPMHLFHESNSLYFNGDCVALQVYHGLLSHPVIDNIFGFFDSLN